MFVLYVVRMHSYTLTRFVSQLTHFSINIHTIPHAHAYKQYLFSFTLSFSMLLFFRVWIGRIMSSKNYMYFGVFILKIQIATHWFNAFERGVKSNRVQKKNSSKNASKYLHVAQCIELCTEYDADCLLFRWNLPLAFINFLIIFLMLNIRHSYCISRSIYIFSDIQVKWKCVSISNSTQMPYGFVKFDIYHTVLQTSAVYVSS